MAWKQPISTEILNSDMFDDIDRLMFLEICIHMRKDKGFVKPFMHGNKHFEVELKRGEMIFNTKRFCRLLNIGNSKGTQKLKKLKNTILKAELKQKPYGFIVSLKSPDEFFKMKLKANSKRTQSELKANANNKSVENERIKEEKIYTASDLKKPSAPSLYSLSFEDGLITINKSVWNGLVKTFGVDELESLIEKMGDYIRKTGKNYKDHNSALREWIRREYGLNTVDERKLRKLTTTDWRRILDQKLIAWKVLRKLDTQIFMEIKDNYPIYF